ncbi:MAG: hypothetical protein ACRDL2_15785 [Gaiellaceae bacterium]
MARKMLWPALVIGIALIVMPFAFSMPSRTAAGDRMMNDFHPLMQAASVQKTVNYYNTVFKPLGVVATQFTQAASDPQMQAQLKPLMPMLQPVMPIFAQVNPGLDWYKPLVDTMQANVADYKSVNELPSFKLFTWFFVIPGILLVLISGFGLWEEREHVHVHRAHPTPA